MGKLKKIKDIENFVIEYIKNYEEPIKVFNFEYYPIDILKEMDPIAFRELILNEIDCLVKDKILIEDEDENYFLNDK